MAGGGVTGEYHNHERYHEVPDSEWMSSGVEASKFSAGERR